MQAYVYKSQRKPDTYIYLAKRDDFDALPAELGATLAPYAFVLEVALTPERRLAQADAALVRANLAERGFHLQLPPTMPVLSSGVGLPSAVNNWMTPPEEFPYSAENAPRSTSMRSAESRLKCDTCPEPSGIDAGMPSV